MAAPVFPQLNISSAIGTSNPTSIGNETGLEIEPSASADSNGYSFWYSYWEVRGSKLASVPRQQFGPIIGTLYTISDMAL